MYLNDKIENDDLRDGNLESLMSSISSDIILEVIEEQVKDVYENKNIYNVNDVFKGLENQINYLIHNCTLENNRYPEVISSINNVLDKISDKIEDKINIDIQYSDVIPVNVKLDYVRSLYNFFVIELHEKIENLVFNFIDDNRDMFDTDIDTVTKKTKYYQYIKNSMGESEYANLVFHLGDIIKELSIPEDMFNEDIIELMTKPEHEELHNYNIERMFINNTWVESNHKQSLITTLKDFILTEDNHVLISNVRLKFIKKYGLKTT